MLSHLDQRKLRQIEIRARRHVQSLFTGAYASVFKGRGIAFDTIRPYVYGDDVRALDWKIFARTQDPYVREYVAEREQTVMIVLDGSASLFFGTEERTKKEKAAELAMILATCANLNHDRVGLLIFTDHVEVYLPPRRSRSHLMHLLRLIWTYQPKHRTTDLNAALRTLLNGLRAHAIVFVLSDFALPPATYERLLAQAGRKHDLSAFYVYDPAEASLPRVGLMALQDAESSQVAIVDTTNGAALAQLRAEMAEHIRARDEAFRRAQVDLWSLPLAEDLVQSLRSFFASKQRAR